MCLQLVDVLGWIFLVCSFCVLFVIFYFSYKELKALDKEIEETYNNLYRGPY